MATNNQSVNILEPQRESAILHPGPAQQSDPPERSPLSQPVLDTNTPHRAQKPPRRTKGMVKKQREMSWDSLERTTRTAVLFGHEKRVHSCRLLDPP
ncbi:unnamed protein product [Lota lota]